MEYPEADLKRPLLEPEDVARRVIEESIYPILKEAKIVLIDFFANKSNDVYEEEKGLTLTAKQRKLRFDHIKSKAMQELM